MQDCWLHDGSSGKHMPRELIRTYEDIVSSTDGERRYQHFLDNAASHLKGLTVIGSVW